MPVINFHRLTRENYDNAHEKQLNLEEIFNWGKISIVLNPLVEQLSLVRSSFNSITKSNRITAKNPSFSEKFPWLSLSLSLAPLEIVISLLVRFQVTRGLQGKSDLLSLTTRLQQENYVQTFLL